MITSIIIEDQPPAQRLLKKYIADAENLELKGIFCDALEAIEFLSTNTVDLIFLDVHLPKLSGIDFMSILSPRPHIIITTAFPDYALKGYELDIVDYLLKPFTFERFYKAVLKVERLMNKKNILASGNKPNQESIIVKVGHNYQRVNVDDIIYVKSDGDYSTIVTQENKYMTLNPLKYWLENLPVEKFHQIHRSFLVNSEHIQKVTGNLVFTGDLQIPIGRVFKKKFIDFYFN